MPVSKQARLAVRDPDTGTALPHGASGELWMHHRVSSNILTIHQRRRGRSMPMACFELVTSLTLQMCASSMRRGSATRFGLAVS